MSYKPEDFEEFLEGQDSVPLAYEFADIANAKLPEIKKQWLEELVKDAPTVYIQDEPGVDHEDCWQESFSPNPTDTRKGRLICIEKL